jgi:hypothetical protein
MSGVAVVMEMPPAFAGGISASGVMARLYFQRKWTNTRPKFFESFSTRSYWALISF